MGQVHRLPTPRMSFSLQTAGRLMTEIFPQWVQDLALLVESIETVRPPGALPDRCTLTRRIECNKLRATCYRRPVTCDLLQATCYRRPGGGHASYLLVRAITTKLRKTDSRYLFCATAAGKSGGTRVPGLDQIGSSRHG